jgi:hypothetical protein
MNYMSKMIGFACIFCLTFGFSIATYGLLSFLFTPSDYVTPELSLLTNFSIFSGLASIFVGVILVPATVNENKKRRIMKIIGVRNRLALFDISTETGFDSEYIRKVITELLHSHAIFGHIEDDFFIRDIDGHSPYSD